MRGAAPCLGRRPRRRRRRRALQAEGRRAPLCDLLTQPRKKMFFLGINQSKLLHQWLSLWGASCFECEAGETYVFQVFGRDVGEKQKCV